MGIVIYALPGATEELTLNNAPPGLVALNSIGVRILDDQGNTLPPGRMNTGIVEFPAGSGHYVRPTVLPSTLGEYSVMWDSDVGGLATPANSAVDKLVITTELVVPVIPIPTPGLPVGPCSLWLTGAEVDAFCSAGATAVGGPAFDAAAEMASTLLFELSGRIFAGACESTVRPCAQTCGCWGGFVGTLAIAGASALGVPINWTGGSWDCGGQSCGCGILSEVILDGYPVTGIVAVKINGVVIPPTAYRLDQYRRLVCTDQQMWPACQDLTAPDTDQGTWSITYTHGQPPPLAGKQAAAQLACQLKQAIDGGACQLDASVQEVVRQGIKVTKGRIATLVNAIGDRPEGSGLAFVDSFLVAYNRHGLQRRPAVWSPDTPRFPRRTL